MERYLIIILDAENVNLSSDQSNFIVILEVIARICCGVVRTVCLLSLNYNSLDIENCAHNSYCVSSLSMLHSVATNVFDVFFYVRT